MGSSADKLRMPSPEEALPGRGGAHARAEGALRERRAARAAVPGRRRSSRSSAWAASGARSASSGRRRASTRRRSATRAASRRTRPTRRSAAGRTGHTEVVLCRVRPERRRLRGAAARLLGEPRPDAGHAPGQRRRHAVPLGDLHATATSSGGGARPRATRTRRRSTRPATARSPPRSARRPEFYYAEDYHQQYLAKNPNGYCGLGGTGVACPVGLAAAEARVTP